MAIARLIACVQGGIRELVFVAGRMASAKWQMPWHILTLVISNDATLFGPYLQNGVGDPYKLNYDLNTIEFRQFYSTLTYAAHERIKVEIQFSVRK